MTSLGPTAGLPVGRQYGLLGGNQSFWTSAHGRHSEMRLNAMRLTDTEVLRNQQVNADIFPHARTQSARAQRDAYRRAMADYAAGPVWRTNQPHQSFTAARTRKWHPAMSGRVRFFYFFYDMILIRGSTSNVVLNMRQNVR